ncbi:RagB/SusD family nutrient uptake outer membrane protein [Flavobacterium sp. ST-75]|uniref:RagB/SusD family nutrient uptake outer membrane protein n=1 Tax=Flavobacterium rhizophilum TaxID=3163296 RepID=A0ABW8Y943_9FLAO
MKHKIKYTITASIAFLAMTLVSCSDFVEVDLPPSQLPGPVVFEDPVTARAAMASIYANMRDNGLFTGNLPGLSCVLGLYADELDFYRQETDYFYTNALFAAQPSVGDYWNGGYSLIYAANAVMEGAQQSQSLTPEVRAQLEGEALFVRAMVHLYLNQLYGGVPYITTTDYHTNSQVSRMTQGQVLEAVRQDLLQAVTLLPEDPSPEKVLPGKGAARALLARTCLYAGLWEEAAEYATAVIDDPQYQWVEDPDTVFLNNSTATLWQFMPADPTLNTLEGSLFIFESGPPPVVALTGELYSAFEPGDLRREKWIREITDGTTSWYHPYKYKQAGPTGTATEYSIILRLAEQYLIRAEARAKTGDTQGAAADLNKIRNRAGLPDTQTADPQQLVTEIIAERRVELFTEFGHRFFDLQRTGLLDNTLQGVKPGWDSSDSLWPVPADEITVNPNITQNPGY